MTIKRGRSIEKREMLEAPKQKTPFLGLFLFKSNQILGILRLLGLVRALIYDTNQKAAREAAPAWSISEAK